uniref:Transposase (Putative), gypsy type n=1 Tax=Tanacetum cinerariifolium TaxID=118510 RepID=A0A6L2JUL9_TANCI|nr:transposase (putative), gypsy type [Tanacetum cinerariifolium]
MGRDIVQLKTAVSTISQDYLLEFTSEYGISEALHPELPGPGERVVDFPEGKVGVYTKFFEFANFRLPLSQFLFDILSYYQIHLSRLSVIGVAKVSHFEINYMDLFNLIHALNPTKVKTGTRPRAAHEGQEAVAPEVPPPENVMTMRVARGATMESTQMHPLKSSKGAAAAGDPESKNTSFTFMVGSPENIYRPKWVVMNGCLLDAPEACQDLMDHIAPPGYFLELRHLHNDDFYM